MIHRHHDVGHLVRRQWDELVIPEANFLQVRNRAWNRLFPPRSPLRFRLLYACGACIAVLLSVLMVWDWNRAPVPVSTVELPASLAREVGRFDDPILAVTQHSPVLREPVPAGPPERVDARSSVENRPVEGVPLTQDDEKPERKKLVMNFRLPQTGVRMIWIQDSQFGLVEGATDED